jgi:hypothetical protein
MVVVLANQDRIMPDQTPSSPVPNEGKAAAAPTAALTPSRLAAVVEARYILDVRRR